MKRIILALVAAAALTMGAFTLTPMGANAARLITSSDIKDQTIKSGDISAEGVGTSEIRNQTIQSGDIAEAGVGASEIRNGSITGDDINDTTERNLKGKAGTDGTNGTDGKDGKDGKDGVANVRADEPYDQSIAAHSVGVAFATCPVAGDVALSGGYRLNGHAAEAFTGGGAAVPGVSVVASEPAGVVDGALVNTYQNPAFPQTERGSYQPNAWAVTIHNDTDADQAVRVAVVCATVGN